MTHPTVGLYQHYKGDYYILMSVATHSETGEELVIYRSATAHKVWVRPKDMFFGGVELAGEVVPRFKKIRVNSENIKPFQEDFY